MYSERVHDGKDLCISVVIKSGCFAAAAAAGNDSSSQNRGTTPGRYVTVREIESMTSRSATVRRLFGDDCEDSAVNKMLLRTGKV